MNFQEDEPFQIFKISKFFYCFSFATYNRNANELCPSRILWLSNHPLTAFLPWLQTHTIPATTILLKNATKDNTLMNPRLLIPIMRNIVASPDWFLQNAEVVLALSRYVVGYCCASWLQGILTFGIVYLRRPKYSLSARFELSLLDHPSSRDNSVVYVRLVTCRQKGKRKGKGKKSKGEALPFIKIQRDPKVMPNTWRKPRWVNRLHRTSIHIPNQEQRIRIGSAVSPNNRAVLQYHLIGAIVGRFEEKHLIFVTRVQGFGRVFHDGEVNGFHAGGGGVGAGVWGGHEFGPAEAGLYVCGRGGEDWFVVYCDFNGFGAIDIKLFFCVSVFLVSGVRMMYQGVVYGWEFEDVAPF
jgi:hypothetical protein